MPKSIGLLGNLHGAGVRAAEAGALFFNTPALSPLAGALGHLVRVRGVHGHVSSRGTVGGPTLEPRGDRFSPHQSAALLESATKKVEDTTKVVRDPRVEGLLTLLSKRLEDSQKLAVLRAPKVRAQPGRR